MKTETIALNIDSRFYKAWLKHYESENLQIYLQSKLSELFKEYLPQAEYNAIMNDIHFENEEYTGNKIGIIRMKYGDDVACFTTKNCRSLLDFAKSYVANVYEDMNRYEMQTFHDCFGGADSNISEYTFQILSNCFGKDESIGFVATIDVADDIISVQTDKHPAIREFDTGCFYEAAAELRDAELLLYKEEIDALEKYIKEYNAEIFPTPSEQSEEPLQMQ